MRLRLDPSKGTQDPFSYALARGTAYATTVGRPFSPKEFWTALRADGLFLEDGDHPLPEGPEADSAGVFTATLALDHLYARGQLRRRLDPTGNYAYSGGP